MLIKIKAITRTICLFLFSSKITGLFFSEVTVRSKIWLSIIYFEKGYIKDGSIGLFNLIFCNELRMENGAKISRSNKIAINGSLFLANHASIGNRNTFTSALNKSVYIERGSIKMGANSIITSDHFFDVMGNISIGNETVIAGKGSQFWTHSYNHYPHRYRIDGDIFIGQDVYVGSGVILLPDCIIGDGCAIGAGTTFLGVVGDETIIVSAKFRHFQRKDRIFELNEITKSESCERVFKKNSARCS